MEPKFKDQSTMVSFERLSLVIEYNQIGSLTSLGRNREHALITRARSNSIRRGSYSSGMFKVAKGSSSKGDLLKSAIEVNHHKSSGQMKISNNYLNRQTANSTGKVGAHAQFTCTCLSDTFFRFMAILRLEVRPKWRSRR